MGKDKRYYLPKMTQKDVDFWLYDRLCAFRNNFEKHNFDEKAVISFSGGKDSVLLSWLVDQAVPNNRIPRVYIDTGIEYPEMRTFVKSFIERDYRFSIVRVRNSVPQVLSEIGYPFKSKEHSKKVSVYQNSGMTKTVSDYLGYGEKKSFLCPNCLRYQFSPDFKLKISSKCCDVFKKNAFKSVFPKEKIDIIITGMRKEEGGLRQSMTSCWGESHKGVKTYSPLFPLSNDFVNDCFFYYDLPLAPLYKEPFFFKRTGCAGCPYNKDLERDLEALISFSPISAKMAFHIWHPVYREYARIGYRISSETFEKLRVLTTTPTIP